MRELKTTIEIAAKPEEVWSILIDIGQWPDWNPIVNKMEGNLKVGEELSITMCDKEGNDGQSYNATITAIDEAKRFSYIGSMMSKFLFAADRIFELEESGDRTLFTQREVFTGLMVPLFWKKLNAHAVPMYHAMNEALKAKAEG